MMPNILKKIEELQNQADLITGDSRRSNLTTEATNNACSLTTS